MSESIYSWIKQGLVKPNDTQRALEVAGERGDADGWFHFIKFLLITLGLLSLAFGVVFFFAYNWNDLGRFYKFLILQVLLVAVFGFYFLKASQTIVSQALLLAGVIVLGALLALFGQTYQTGADPWQLFATWALLIFPLVLFARSEALWLFWALLINTALTLYLQINHSLFGWFFSSRYLPWLYLLLNGLMLLLMEWLATEKSPRNLALAHRWAAQVLGLVVLYALTVIGMELIWGNHQTQYLNIVLYMVSMPGFFVVYRYIKPDLLLLTAWALALIIFIMAFLAETLFQHFDAGGMLLMAMTLIGLTTVAVTWIKKTHKQLKVEQANE